MSANSTPAAFFAAPPATPSALLEARNSLLADSSTATKFQDAVREARAGGNRGPAASGSWVCGEYEKALNLVDGDDELACFIRGNSAYELGHYQDAKEALQGLANSNDQVLATSALMALDAASAHEELATAVGKASLGVADSSYFKARLLEIEGKTQEACDLYEEILSADPSHYMSRFRLAFRCDLHGNTDDAKRHYEALLERRPIPSPVLVNLGLIYEDQNQFEKACGCFGAVLRGEPNHRLARLYYRDSHESLDMFYDEDLERKEDRLMQVLRTPISDFELSVRARNCLPNMDIRTLGDLVSHSEPELLEFKNFGETSLNEIKRVLQAKGLRLGIRREDGTFLIPEEFDADDNFDPDKDLAWLGGLTDDMRDALDLQISTLNLSVRCHRALVERLNLQKVSDILRFSEEDLLGMPNFGITSLNELTSKLHELNLRLRSGRGDEYSEV